MYSSISSYLLLSRSECKNTKHSRPGEDFTVTVTRPAPVTLPRSSFLSSTLTQDHWIDSSNSCPLFAMADIFVEKKNMPMFHAAVLRRSGLESGSDKLRIYLASVHIV